MKIYIKNEMIKFILVGFFNTGHYYIWYLLFSELFQLHYIISHWVAFLLSMIGSFFLNTYFTYNTKPSWRKFLRFPLTYLVNILASTSALYILTEYFRVDPKLGALLASGFAIPFTFILSGKILKSKKRDKNET
ncbi:GtrA family protein [Ornithinibacillus californiensis]|uniref:GtrA family protein n=1 Tax=Ornithinibacillus californiensis TaxID=161536 RepID=UPI00064DB1EA|nr:GtrA family protein [Ornithinibacillus californiensis]